MVKSCKKVIQMTLIINEPYHYKVDNFEYFIGNLKNKGVQQWYICGQNIYDDDSFTKIKEDYEKFNCNRCKKHKPFQS